MTRIMIIWGAIILGCTIQALFGTEADNTPDYTSREDNPPEYMSKEDREMLKEEARDMFYHAYNAYMDNAYPADELMPLSCKGRYRNSEPDRGDIDSTLGNFSLTLVDTLDTLVVLGDLGEFENAVRLVVKDVAFDTDVIVSLFETNIRMLGGLLSGHILAEYLQSRADIMPWYRGELLNLAKDLGYRFLPAFNTTTGIPFGRINLKNGMKGVPAEMCRETCTACAGSMILEMAALSRLTGEPIFEEKAQKAMDALWKMRHRGTDLMGSVLNVHSGDWVRRDSGVGAGIDSYYEYCLKAYILLGDEKYLGRFNKHYQAVMKYVSQGPMLLDVHMHRPNTNSKNFMDALLAFWPGLQVLKGDIKPAVETHEMLYQVMQRHNFIPEAFTTDFQVHWGHHPLRPEFLESTYFLYRATGDHYYLGVGRKVLKSLQTYARVACGYAAVSDVRTNKHDDTMDSFVLSETLKYLYLLFAEPNDLVLDLDEFIFTTEGHLLPLTLAAVRTNITSDLDRDIVEVDELDRTCPNSLHLFPASVRQPLRNMVEDVCPRRSVKRRLSASQFQANNLEHLKILSNMGITILTPAAGRVQVLHTFSNARTTQDAEEGLLFMQEMAELSKKQAEQSETRPQLVTYVRNDENPAREVTLLAGPAHFGPRLKDGKKITGTMAYANPFEACSELREPENLVGKIVMLSRGNCMFVEKARRIQKAGAIAGIIFDNVAHSSAAESAMFAMSGDGKDPDDVTIPLVFMFTREAGELVVAHFADNSIIVTIGDYTLRDEIQLNAPGDLSVFERLKGSLKDFLTRQVTPENSASRPSETTSEMFTIDGLHLPIEYKITDCHLKAMIHEKSGFVKIVRSEWSPPISKERKFFSEMEKSWHEIKQKLVNNVYLRNDIEIAIPLSKIRFQYIFVHKFRGFGIFTAVNKISTSIMVAWFLQELKDIAPEKTDVKNDENSHDKSAETIIDDLFENQSSDVERETNTEKKNSENRQDVTSTQSHLEKIVDQMNFESSMVEFEYEFINFKTALLAEGRKLSMENLKNSRDIEKNVDDDSSMTTTHKYLQAWLDREKTIVNVRLVEKIELSVGKNNDNWKLDKYERVWYELRQFLVNLIYCYDRETVKIPLEKVKSQYKFVQSMRGLPSVTSVKKIIEWYVKELGELNPGPEYIIDTFHFLTGRKESKDSEDLKKTFTLSELEEVVENSDDSKASNILDRNIDETRKKLDGEKKIEDPEILINVDKSKGHLEDFRKNHKILDEKTVNLATDDSSRDLRFMENEENTKNVDETSKAGDPMEEFKKPLWASDNEKSDPSDENSEYTKEYSRRVKNDFEKSKTSGKRFVDDL